MTGRAEGAETTLTDDQRLSWLQLARSENVGPITFHRLIERYGSAENALAALPELSRRGGMRRPPRLFRRDDAEREMERADTLGCRFIAACEALYPQALRWAEGSPPLLAMRGDPAVLKMPSVSIVGSRNASIAGLKMARSLAGGVGQSGYSVTSGLARGIDAEAHRAALPTGTIAVLAGGLDRPYPQQNIALLEAIFERGAAVSEMPFGWEPRAVDFPRRNRIVAGLGLGLVVVEAARKSGSLISARLAGEFGRLVFAVPGSPLDPRAKGTNDLIRDGAILTSEAADIVQALRPIGGGQGSLDFRENEEEPTILPKPARALSADDRTRVVEVLGPAPVDMDVLIRHTDLAPSEIYLALLELDIAGRLERHPNGMVSVTPSSMRSVTE